MHSVMVVIVLTKENLVHKADESSQLLPLNLLSLIIVIVVVLLLCSLDKLSQTFTTLSGSCL